MASSLPEPDGDLSDFLGSLEGVEWGEVWDEARRSRKRRRQSSGSSKVGSLLSGKSTDGAVEADEDEGKVPKFPLRVGHPYHIVVVCGQECPTASGVLAGRVRTLDGKGWTSMLEKYLCGGCSHDSDSESSSSDEVEVVSPPRSGVSGGEEVEEVLDPISRPTTDNSAPSTDTDDPSCSAAGETASLTSSHLAPSRSSNSSNRRPRGPYVLVDKERLMGIYCAVFVARYCEDLVEGVSTGRVTAGLIGGRVGNKGGVGISLNFASTRLLFVSAHLAAHASGFEIRKANAAKILEELGGQIDDFWSDEGRMGPKPRRLVDRFDQTFFMGDLNFRLNISRLHADWLVRGKDYETALRFDQLRSIMDEPNSVFRGFHEAPIKFGPTYKFDLPKKVTKKRSMLMRGKSAAKKLAASEQTKSNSLPPHLDPSMANGGAITDPEVMPATSRTDNDSMSVISSAETVSTVDTAAASVVDLSLITRDDLSKTDLSQLGLPTPPMKGRETSMDAVRKAQVRFLTLVKSNSTAAAMEYAKRQKDEREGTVKGRGRTASSATARPGFAGLFTPLRPILQKSQSALALPTTAKLSSSDRNYGDEGTPGQDDDEDDEAVDQDNEDSIVEATFDTSRKQRVQSWTDRILFYSSVDPPADGPFEPEPAPPIPLPAPTLPPVHAASAATTDRPSADGIQHLRFDHDSAQPTPRSLSAVSISSSQASDDLSSRQNDLRFGRTRSFGGLHLGRLDSNAGSTETLYSAETQPSTSLWKRAKSFQALASLQNSSSPPASTASSPLQSPGISSTPTTPTIPNASQPSFFHPRRTPRKKFTLSASPSSSSPEISRTTSPAGASTPASESRPPLVQSASETVSAAPTDPTTTPSTTDGSAGPPHAFLGTGFPRSRTFSAALNKLHERERSIGNSLNQLRSSGTNLSASGTALNTRFKTFLSSLPLPFLSATVKSADAASGADVEDAHKKKELVGPRPGEIEVLEYDSVLDMAKMRATSDHRPVYLVCAVGFEEKRKEEEEGVPFA
ncbi:inositolor phosphatidylinositol phosphatase [Rhodotorula toruloides]|uniref:Inositolor phosphatidylinositol phosphatase n=1 Tax=Rhodotorula toruloides TaxID=5286 RepID=A0A511KP33_RHOTO|nr:inositolor phosphatidylinositol phosphatase [Rhodotorula toruloides]